MQVPHNGEAAYGRRGHTPQISISDESHHVTEAIGGMYGSDDEEYMAPARRNSRPLSFVASAAEVYDTASYFDTKRASPPRSPLQQTAANEKLPSHPHPYPHHVSSPPKGSPDSENVPLSPKSSTSTETAVQQFPLNDIDYESSPAAVAQELSNLQAIRRMSMNVDTADPDLPSFGGPGATPSDTSDEDDASRLFWVPARLHPELAPKEFKTFVEDRVDRLRKRSGSGDSLSPGLDRSDSDGLRRKKSMLSRQIDSPKGYEDGAERLHRKRSESNHAQSHPTVENLQELEGLVSNINPDASRTSLDSGVDVSGDQNMPILPPPGPTLKRSTRTYMRKDRAPYSKRALNRQSESDSEPPRARSPSVSNPDEPLPGLARVQTEPSQDSPPSRERLLTSSSSSENLRETQSPQNQTRTTFHSRIASNGRTTAPVPGYSSPIPQIVETPPPPNQYTLPERKSSHTAPSNAHTPPSNAPSNAPSQPGNSRPPLISSKGSRGKSSIRSAQVSSRPPSSTLDDISSNPSPLPGSGGTRTDALTLVPTYEEKKVEKKDSRKPSWNWLLGSEEKDREREKEKDRKSEEKERDKEASKKYKSSKLSRGSDKTRLDVLQSSIDGNATAPRGRESLVLDRESIKLEEERKKESTRRSTDGKKDKDSGILSAIFGGGKRSKQQHHHHHHHVSKESNRALSPEPPPRILRPDIDYNWTRFSILEERAIYRMAHIKLANPRRPLHSQVLLSNFMYSYLAKVQLYHPQSQASTQKAAQSRQQQSQQQQSTTRSEESQGDDHNKYQKWQEQRQGPGDAYGGAEQTAPQTANASQQGHDQDYLGYSTTEQPFDQSDLWQDEEKSDLW